MSWYAMKFDMTGLTRGAIIRVEDVTYRVFRRDFKRNKVWVRLLADATDAAPEQDSVGTQDLSQATTGESKQ